MKKIAFTAIVGLCLAACVGRTAQNAGTPFVSESGDTLWAAYQDVSGGQMAVTYPCGKKDTFAQAIAASGSRYVKGNLELWEHHGEITLRQDDSVVFTGKNITP